MVNNLDTLLKRLMKKGYQYLVLKRNRLEGLYRFGEYYFELGRITAQMAAQILNGEKVDEMPVRLISESKPVANADVMAALQMELPAEYTKTIEYLTGN